MREIKNADDFLIVPKVYFDVMQKKLQELIEDVDICNFATMEKVLYLRDWLNALNVDREIRTIYPNINFAEIYKDKLITTNQLTINLKEKILCLL